MCLHRYRMIVSLSRCGDSPLHKCLASLTLDAVISRRPARIDTCTFVALNRGIASVSFSNSLATFACVVHHWCNGKPLNPQTDNILLHLEYALFSRESEEQTVGRGARVRRGARSTRIATIKRSLDRCYWYRVTFVRYLSFPYTTDLKISNIPIESTFGIELKFDLRIHTGPKSLIMGMSKLIPKRFQKMQKTGTDHWSVLTKISILTTIVVSTDQ